MRHKRPAQRIPAQYSRNPERKRPTTIIKRSICKWTVHFYT
ncbi:hypothetical protein BVRB_9g225820 [Beta vulgaris subsp. vulgaris]|uniref:Uncharacterized protein n=1 Tax=Beta vulgaris subsp. vulgaris TaxID=3555 RepID=A0A0J8B948_BETVV|nr:hypothetical protein BVRB_9g225820 [Beta vulgaris subsp. vulgaris]